MADWTDDDDLTESDDTDNRPLLGVSHLGTGDHMTLLFEDDGEKVDTKYGTAVGFDARLIETSGYPKDDNGENIEPGAHVRMMSDSSRLLGEMAEYDPVSGAVLHVTREGVEYDTHYTVEQVDPEDVDADLEA